MDTQITKRNSKIWPMLLLGVLVLIVLILIFGKKQSIQNSISQSREDKIIQALQASNKKSSIPDSVQADVIKRLSSKQSKSSITAKQQEQIISQLSASGAK